MKDVTQDSNAYIGVSKPRSVIELPQCTADEETDIRLLSSSHTPVD